MACKFQAFFDDSNSHRDADFILWAGLAGFENQWAVLDDEWRRVLSRERLSALHMANLQSRSPPFDRPDPNGAWRDRLIHDFRQIIFRSGVFGISVAVPYDEWSEAVPQEIQEWTGAPGAVCLELCQALAVERASTRGWDRPISMIFDGGVEREARCAAEFTSSLINAECGMINEVEFMSVSDVPGLQAADLLAWELQHDLKDHLRLGGGRTVRAHFLPWWKGREPRLDVRVMAVSVVREHFGKPEFKQIWLEIIQQVEAARMQRNEPQSVKLT